MLILKNARLIPYLAEGPYEGLADIVVEDGRIQEITQTGFSVSPDGAEILDVQGKTVMPGMFDLHMHLYFSSSDFFALGAKSQNEYVFDAIRSAGEYMKQGFTTIRDCGNVFGIGIALRNAVNCGLISGPRILTAGQCLSPYAKGNDTFPNLYCEVNTPEEILKACRKEYAQGVDFFKYMATGSVANLNGEPGELVSSREELLALQAAAESLGTYAGVHCHGKEGILLCAEAGIHTIEHASMIDESCIDLILQKGGHTAIIPTLDPVIQLHRGYECGKMPHEIFKKIEQVYDHTADLVRATRAGVLTGWGTDCSYDFFSRNIGYEFDARREIGYTNEEILRQATIDSAKVLGLQEDLGTIAPGKLADMIVINGKPDQDISAMFSYPLAVFKEGKRYF